MRRFLPLALPLMLALSVVPGSPASAQQPFEPQVGQPGKDVVWVPTTPQLLEKMLDMAKVTPRDFVVDLGSGDGRNIIAAARRGARGLGVEYNADMVDLSRRLAREAGVAEKTTFVQGDMYEADFSNASVLALFLLPGNLEQLRDKFLALKPGTRIVLNTFGIGGWEPDAVENIGGDCSSWCTSLLYIVPAQVGGTWRLPQAELTLTQQFQTLSGALSSEGNTTLITVGRLYGDEITFTVDDAVYTGRVSDDRIEGTARVGDRLRNWIATRAGNQ